MNPLLTEYTELYKAAFADVDRSLGWDKTASPLGALRRLFSRGGKQVDEVAEVVDKPVEALRNIASSKKQVQTAQEAADAAREGFLPHREAFDEVLQEAGFEPTRTRRMTAVTEATPTPGTKGTQATQAAGTQAGQTAGTQAGQTAGTQAGQTAGTQAGQTAGTQAIAPTTDAAEEVLEAAPKTPAQGRSDALRGALLAGTGVLGAGIGGHQIGRMRERELADRNRNLAFGAGVASGMAAPGLMSSLGSTLSQISGASRPPSGGVQPPAQRSPQPTMRGRSPYQSMYRQRGY